LKFMNFYSPKTLLVIIFFFIFACSDNNPKPVAKNFLTALNHLDFKKAKEYSTEETGKLLDMMSGFARMIPDSSKEREKKFEITGEIIDGDKATVSYKEEGREDEQSIPLVKVNGQWKVAMSKDNMNEAESSSRAEETDSTETSTPADTISK
jgi:hypothetical protein